MIKQNNNDSMEITKKLSSLTRMVGVLIALVVVNISITLVLLGDTGTTDSGEDLPEYDVSTFTEITAEDYVNLFKSDEFALVYIGREDCGYCRYFIPVLKEAQETYDFTVYYLDMNKLSQETFTMLQNLDPEIKENLGQTPYTIISKNGKIVDSFLGYGEISKFGPFLETNGIKKR